MIVDIQPGTRQQALHGVGASRRIEVAAAAGLPAQTLMQRAGQAVARLTLALAPAARRVWVLSGPGNNGGDGFEAALWLHQAGWQVHVTDVGNSGGRPADAAAARVRAVAAGVPIGAEAPPWQAQVAIDALFGLGAKRALSPEYTNLIGRFDAVDGVRMAIDLPSGIDADTGLVYGEAAVRATDTLSLLTLKPGLFTAAGRDHAGRIWFDDLGATTMRLAEPAAARIAGSEELASVRPLRSHQAHKGSFGDVLVIGGAPGMDGALRLAARAALASGAGRVYACALDPLAALSDSAWPEVMCRPMGWPTALEPTDQTVVAGCGGGDRVAAVLAGLLSRAPRLVLDADGLNAVAGDTSLQHLLACRAGRGLHTVLTPHPLEAARLLGQTTASSVQADRLNAAQSLAKQFECTVLLKGSGTVIAVPGEVPVINTTGNARLATAGSGDVLAGWLAGLWASAQADARPSGFTAAVVAAYEHGLAAGDAAAATLPMTASALLRRLTVDHGPN